MLANFMTTSHRVIWEERTPAEKMYSPDWPWARLGGIIE